MIPLFSLQITVKTMTIKLLLENWKKFLNEAEKKTYSFDFDETLVTYKPDPEDPEFSIVYDGPHEENIAKLRELAAEGHTVLIVTSRAKRTGDKHPWDTAPDPEDLVVELDLPVESIHYTHGDLKADTLLSLGVIEHWDDDEEEVAAAEAAGIRANLVPSVLEEGAIAKWWVNKLHEDGVKITGRMQKYLKNHSDMKTDSLQ